MSTASAMSSRALLILAFALAPLAAACSGTYEPQALDGDSMPEVEDAPIGTNVLYACTCRGTDGIKRSYIKETINGVLVAETRPCDLNGVCVRQR